MRRSVFRSSLVLVALFAPFSTALSAQIPVDEYAARREALAARFDEAVVIAYGGREPERHWPPFYQFPAFRYLTGFLQSNAAFVLSKHDDVTKSVLFVARPDPRRALYDGDRLTPPQIAAELGLTARFTDELEAYVDSLVALEIPVYAVADFQANEFSARDTLSAGRMFMRRLEARHEGLQVREINNLLDQFRAKKSEPEVELLTKAAEISSKAHEAAIRAIRPGVSENEIQAVMEAEFRRLGGDTPSYSSIVGSGPNATVLHYPAGTRVARAGEVVLMDAAAYYDGYSADVTRAVPVTPTFSPELRDFYTVVLNAQKAGEREIEPGAQYADVNEGIRGVLRSGLVDLGLIQSETATFDPPPGLCPGTWANDDGSCPQWYLFAYHGFMHGVGLDVHDPSQFSGTGQFQPGDVFTIEPGLYVRERVFTDLPDTPRNRALIDFAGEAVERYKNFGVRIEDDYVLTPEGLRRISTAPREIEEIEALRARVIS